MTRYATISGVETRRTFGEYENEVDKTMGIGL